MEREEATEKIVRALSLFDIIDHMIMNETFRFSTVYQIKSNQI